jgi:murein DD-endopeptidase MepM/ murein hydrolase activator NlpD
LVQEEKTLLELQRGPVLVSEGQVVRKADLLGRDGHSGNQTALHQHYHLMGRTALRTVRGIPCGFERYEVWEDGAWRAVRNEIPTNRRWIRFVP